MYLPKDQAGLSNDRILRALKRKYPDLNCDINVISRMEFLEDPPHMPPGKRSRINDQILLLDGEEFYRRLKKYPEEFRFYLSQGFSVTLKGGIRGEDNSPNLASNFASAVMIGSSAEAMRNAKASY